MINIEKKNYRFKHLEKKHSWEGDIIRKSIRIIRKHLEKKYDKGKCGE